MSAKDRRQFDLMRRQIENYEAGHLPLGSLIGDLEFLHTALEQEEPLWVRRYRDQLGILEECYAMMLDEERSALGEQESKLVSEAIIVLKSLVSEKSPV